jgi:hypothetical protein
MSSTETRKVTIECPKCEGEGFVRFVHEGSEHIVLIKGHEPGVWQNGTCWTCQGRKTVEVDAKPHPLWAFAQRQRGEAPRLVAFVPSLFIERVTMLAIIQKITISGDQVFGTYWKPTGTKDDKYRLSSVTDSFSGPMGRYLMDHAPILDAETLRSALGGAEDDSGMLYCPVTSATMLALKPAKRAWGSLKKSFGKTLDEEGHRTKWDYERMNFDGAIYCVTNEGIEAALSS